MISGKTGRWPSSSINITTAWGQSVKMLVHNTLSDGMMLCERSQSSEVSIHPIGVQVNAQSRLTIHCVATLITSDLQHLLSDIFILISIVAWFNYSTYYISTGECFFLVNIIRRSAFTEMSKKFQNQVVLITGATNGTG